jgi:hypothetical protein
VILKATAHALLAAGCCISITTLALPRHAIMHAHHSKTPGGTELNEHMLSITTPRFFLLGHVWTEVLKFNKYCSTFILFDKKIQF